jgi:hypothetical protein
MNLEYQNKQASQNVWLSRQALIARVDRLWTLQAGVTPGLSERFSTRTQGGMIRLQPKQLEQVRPKEALFTL